MAQLARVVGLARVARVAGVARVAWLARVARVQGPKLAVLCRCQVAT